MRKFIVAAVQMDSTDNLEENLTVVKSYIEEAVQRGAKLVAFPESMNYCGRKPLDFAEDIPDGSTFKFLADLAKKHNIWIHGGSIYEKNGEDPRPYNCTMVISPEGKLRAKYRKLHPFDVVISNGPSVKESDRICPGKEIVTVDTKEVGHLGLAICYDIRFGEIFRIMAEEGAQILLTPANFTQNTGMDHWETILRTRAIENECYVVAPGQIGVKPRFTAYGNSLIIDPWGKVIARASNFPGLITAEIDLDYVEAVRHETYTLANRRKDIYSLKRIEK